MPTEWLTLICLGEGGREEEGGREGGREKEKGEGLGRRDRGRWDREGEREEERKISLVIMSLPWVRIFCERENHHYLTMS